MLNITSALNYGDNNMQAFSTTAVKTKTCTLFFFYSSCCMDFAGLCCPVTSNSNLSGKERQISLNGALFLQLLSAQSISTLLESSMTLL